MSNRGDGHYIDDEYYDLNSQGRQPTPTESDSDVDSEIETQRQEETIMENRRRFEEKCQAELVEREAREAHEKEDRHRRAFEAIAARSLVGGPPQPHMNQRHYRGHSHSESPGK